MVGHLWIILLSVPEPVQAVVCQLAHPPPVHHNVTALHSTMHLQGAVMDVLQALDSAQMYGMHVTWYISNGWLSFLCSRINF